MQRFCLQLTDISASNFTLSLTSDPEFRLGKSPSVGGKLNRTDTINALLFSFHSLLDISGGPAPSSRIGAMLVAHASLNGFDLYVPFCYLLLYSCKCSFIGHQWVGRKGWSGTDDEVCRWCTQHWMPSTFDSLEWGGHDSKEVALQPRTTSFPTSRPHQGLRRTWHHLAREHLGWLVRSYAIIWLSVLLLSE